MTQTTRTAAEQDIEQVAGIIYDNGLSRARAEAYNARDGWTYEVRYDYQDYTDGNSYTRVEGRSLTAAALTDALALADTWRAGGPHPIVQE